jgi:hypothetical protein
LCSNVTIIANLRKGSENLVVFVVIVAGGKQTIEDAKQADVHVTNTARRKAVCVRTWKPWQIFHEIVLHMPLEGSVMS